MEYVLVYLKLFGSLALVLVLAYGTVRYLLPYLQHGRLLQSRRLEVIERLALAPRSSLYLVKAGSRYFVVGLTPTTIAYLTEIDAADLQQAEAGAAAAFSSILQRSKTKAVFPWQTGDKHEE